MLEGDRTLFKYVRSRNSQISRPDVVSGSTPPGVFVGRFGYPKVFVGPMVPRIYGDTSLLDTPEMWRGKTIEDIVDYRYSRVRGCSKMDVDQAVDASRLLSDLQEVAMSSRPADSELKLARSPV